MIYTIVLFREQDGRYSVSVPALKGCHTWGETVPHALRMAEEAILAYLDGERELGRLAPPPDAPVFPLDMEDFDEALVYKLEVAVDEEAAVA